MNEMYNMSIVTHYYSVLAVLGAIVVNLFMVMKADDLKKYKRFNTLFNPIGGTFIGMVIFTGVVMMASKHLDFTIENIIMIFIAVFIIILEVKRNKPLKYMKVNDENGLKEYKSSAIKLLSIQIAALLSISAWMLI